MICPVCQDLLHRRLDGDDFEDELTSHLEQCSICEQDRVLVQRFVFEVQHLRSPDPSYDLADRIFDTVVSDLPVRTPMSWRRHVVLVGSAMAAAILLMLFPGSPTTKTMPESKQVVSTDDKPTLPLRHSMEEAQSAVVSLTSRTANETVETTSQFLPLVPMGSLEAPDPSHATLDPSMEPLRSAGIEVSTTVAPVADSARRAVGLFLRDLPMGRTIVEKKPG